MSKLKAYYNSELIAELALKVGSVYFIGRSEQCHIVLPEERGISRQHLKISEISGSWKISKLSRYAQIIYNNQNYDELELTQDLQFQVGPFLFEFTAIEPVASFVSEGPTLPENAPSTSSASSTPVSSAPSSLTPDPLIAIKTEDDEDTSSGNFEATQAGPTHLVPFVKIIHHSSMYEETLKLEGHAWSLGRSPDCEIYINDQLVSRKHFEITRRHDGYYVTDLGSANKTELNGDVLEPNKAYPLKSGDHIKVKAIEIIFQIRNTKFDHLIQNLPALPENNGNEDNTFRSPWGNGPIDDEALQDSNSLAPYDSPGDGPRVIKVTREQAFKNHLKNKKIQLFLGAFVILSLWVWMNSEPTQTTVTHSGQWELSSKKEVTPEQMKLVREKYELAKKNYFERGNYTFCRDLLKEVHEIVPFFEDSKNLSSLCEQSIELVQIRQEREEKERKRQEAENKIKNTVAHCRSLVSNKTTVESMRQCLNPALELDPGHIDAMMLIKEIEEKHLQAQQQEQNRQALAARLQQARAQFQRARTLENQGQLRAALNEYSRFLAQPHPALSQETRSAQRSIATIQRTIEQTIAERIQNCTRLIDQGQFKEGIQSCELALREDPKNKSALEAQEKARKTMHRNLRSIYEDSRLEESMGNIEAAKLKWRKIMSDSFAGEEFYEKSKSKLKKYEG